MSETHEIIYIDLSVKDIKQLIDIEVDASSIWESVRNKTYHEFRNNEDLKLSVEYSINSLGSSASLISNKIRQKLPYVKWKCMKSLAHILDDEEDGEVKDEILWDISTHFVPEILKSLQPIFSIIAMIIEFKDPWLQKAKGYLVEISLPKNK